MNAHRNGLNEMTYTIAQLKKMNTLRLATVYAKIKGHFPSYPFDRQMMIVAIPTVNETTVENTTSVLECEINRVNKSAKIVARASGVMLTADELHEIETQNQKGRKHVFNYEQALAIFTMESIGMTYKQIAAEMESSYQMIYQVLNGDSYDWIFKMTHDYIYAKSIEIVSQQIALPLIVKVKSLFGELQFAAN